MRLNDKYEKLTLGKYPALTLENACLKRGEAPWPKALRQQYAKPGTDGVIGCTGPLEAIGIG